MCEKDSYNPEEIKIQVVKDEDANGAAISKLKEEKERLLKRIAEIDRILATQG